VSVAAGFELPSRKANSGSSAMGSFLSALLDAVVLKAHRDSVEGAIEVRGVAPLAFEIAETGLAAALRQALQTYDEAALERYILGTRRVLWVHSGMALGISTFSMTSVFRAPMP
jgi:hypothetical protein